jgi:cation transport ATPase
VQTRCGPSTPRSDHTPELPSPTGTATTNVQRPQEDSDDHAHRLRREQRTHLLDQVPVNDAGPHEWTEGIQIEIHIGHVRADEIVIVPPGEQIPVTGTVIAFND